MVDAVEGVVIFAVDVEDGDDFSVMTDGDYDLAFRFRGAGDVSRELMDIGYDERFVLFPRRTAYTFAEGDASASDRTLEGT